MSDIPYDEYKQQEEEVFRLLEKEHIFLNFSHAELLERGIYFIPPGVEVRFVPLEYMGLFEPYTHGKLKILKLHNYGRPATSIRFNSKHKYATYRNINKGDVQEMIVNELAKTEDKYKAATVGLNLSDPDQLALFHMEEQEYKNRTDRLKHYLENMEAYEFTLSSYFRYYTYFQVTIRYVEENSAIGYMEQHLAKSKANIIFVSEELSHKHKEHGHKKIEKFLNSLDQVLSRNTNDLFAQKTKP